MKIHLPTNGWFHYFTKPIKIKRPKPSPLIPVLARLQANPKYKLISESKTSFFAEKTAFQLGTSDQVIKVKGLVSTYGNKRIIRLSVQSRIEGPSIREMEEIKLELLGPVTAIYTFTSLFATSTGHVIYNLDENEVRDFFGGDL